MEHGACLEELYMLCQWIFEGAKSQEICCIVLSDIARQGYHLLVDDRLYRHVYKKLKEKGLVRRKRLVNPDMEKRAVRWGLVAHKENIYSLIKTLYKIVEAPTPWTWH